MAADMQGMILSEGNHSQMEPLHALVHPHPSVSPNCLLPLTRTMAVYGEKPKWPKKQRKEENKTRMQNNKNHYQKNCVLKPCRNKLGNANGGLRMLMWPHLRFVGCLGISSMLTIFMISIAHPSRVFKVSLLSRAFCIPITLLLRPTQLHSLALPVLWHCMFNGTCAEL